MPAIIEVKYDIAPQCRQPSGPDYGAAHLVHDHVVDFSP
jgi:hypothetical protein